MLQRTGGAHHGDFHTAPEARIEPDDPHLTRRRGQQQLFEIAAKNRDRFVVGACLELKTQLHFNSRGQNSTIAIERNKPQLRRRSSASRDLVRQARVDIRHRRFHAPHQLFFGLATTNRQHAMTRNGAECFAVVEVVFELGFVAGFARLHGAPDDALGTRHFAHPAAHHGVFRQLFRQNVASALQCGFDGRHFAICHNKSQCVERGLLVSHRIGPQPLGQWSEPALARDHGPCAALRFEREVQVLQRLLCVRAENRRAQGVVQFALLVDTLENRCTTSFEFL